MMEAVSLRLNERVAIPKLWIANNFFARFLGLMGKKTLAANEGIIFPNCNSIHTCFMRFPIDVIFVEERGTVVDIAPALKPWRLLWPRKKAKHVIELGPQQAAALGISVGCRLECREVWA